MFEYLPQLSDDIVRATIMKHLSERHGKLGREEGLADAERELDELMRVNKGVGRGVVAAVNSPLDGAAEFADASGSEDVKTFWKTISPQVRGLLIEGILLLLRGIDQVVWAKEMGNLVEESR